MKTKTKVLFIVAITLILVGLLTVGTVFLVAGDHLTRINTMPLIDRTCAIEQPFCAIDINVTDSDIEILPSSTAKPYVVFREAENGLVVHSLTVENQILKIKEVDQRHWIDRIGVFETPKVKIYLPAASFDSLSICGSSTDVLIGSGCTFGSVAIDVVSGDVDFSADVRTECKITTTSGDVGLHGIEAKSVHCETTSGEVALSACNGELVFVKTTSGDVELDRVGGQQLHTLTTSGDIVLFACDAQNLSLKTTSGDVEGSLTATKIFSVKTTSGDIELPDAAATGGSCEITTTSGDVEIELYRP